MITLTQLLKFSWFSLFTWQVCHRKHLSSLSSNSKPGGHLGDDRLVPLLHGHELLLPPLPGCLGGPWYKNTSKENLNVKLFT
jgi:hypothetical protein